MKLEHQSRNLLAATKSKAKLNEFLVPQEFHFPLSDPLQDLLILSIGILGQLSAKELTTSITWDSVNNDEIDSLKRQLVLVAEYFDALHSSGEESEISEYLTLLGASAYYLGEMPVVHLFWLGGLMPRNFTTLPIVISKMHLYMFLRAISRWKIFFYLANIPSSTM